MKKTKIDKFMKQRIELLSTFWMVGYLMGLFCLIIFYTEYVVPTLQLPKILMWFININFILGIIGLWAVMVKNTHLFENDKNTRKNN